MNNTGRLRVSYQGISGSYSEQAILEYAKKTGLDLVPCPCHTFRELFSSINKDTGLGMVPIENTTTGSVVECYDLFLEYDLRIIGEFLLPIRHCLIAGKGTVLDRVKSVYSHPQALAQCSVFLEEKGLTPCPVLDTAGAVAMIAEKGNPEWAAIGSEIAVRDLEVEIISRDISNRERNTTRFLFVRNKDREFGFEKDLPEPDKSTVIFQVDDIPAALYKCLGGFATNYINMLKIESRPSQRENFEYIFYLDFEGNETQRLVQLSLKELDFFSKHMVFLGSYKKDSHK